jgi:hypothetical protein
VLLLELGNLICEIEEDNLIVECVVEGFRLVIVRCELAVFFELVVSDSDSGDVGVIL